MTCTVFWHNLIARVFFFFGWVGFGGVVVVWFCFLFFTSEIAKSWRCFFCKASLHATFLFQGDSVEVTFNCSEIGSNFPVLGEVCSQFCSSTLLVEWWKMEWSDVQLTVLTICVKYHKSASGWRIYFSSFVQGPTSRTQKILFSFPACVFFFSPNKKWKSDICICI